MSITEPVDIDREWEAKDVDDICRLLVERHGVRGAKRRAFEVASRLKMLHPEDSE